MYTTYSRPEIPYPNKRLHDREAVYIHAQWWSCDGSGEELPVLITELAEGGVALLGDLMVETGQKAVLRFILPQSAQRVDCEIVNIWLAAEEGRSGWKFLHCTDQGRRQIAQWLVSFRHPRGIPVFNGKLF